MNVLLYKNNFLNSKKSSLETLNKRKQCVPYLYTCKFNKITVPC